MHRPLRFWPAALLCAGCTLAAPAMAQPVKPGLWEISTHIQHSDKAAQDAMAQMQAQMASMPPAQRTQMQAMLARQGVSMDGQSGMRVKSCVTPEEASRLEVPVQKGNCKTTPAKRSGNTVAYSYQCTDPVVQGEATVTFSGPTAYTMHNESTVTENGKPRKTTMDAEGRWLQDDCAGAMNAPSRKKR